MKITVKQDRSLPRGRWVHSMAWARASNVSRWRVRMTPGACDRRIRN